MQQFMTGSIFNRSVQQSSEQTAPIAGRYREEPSIVRNAEPVTKWNQLPPSMERTFLITIYSIPIKMSIQQKSFTFSCEITYEITYKNALI